MLKKKRNEEQTPFMPEPPDAICKTLYECEKSVVKKS